MKSKTQVPVRIISLIQNKLNHHKQHNTIIIKYTRISIYIFDMDLIMRGSDRSFLSLADDPASFCQKLIDVILSGVELLGHCTELVRLILWQKSIWICDTLFLILQHHAQFPDRISPICNLVKQQFSQPAVSVAQLHCRIVCPLFKIILDFFGNSAICK